MDFNTQLFSRKCYYICLVLLMNAGIIYAINKVVYIPYSDIIGVCTLYKITGYYCPGCGGTRATLALLHGDILISIKYHPIVLYVATLLVFFIGTHTLSILSHNKIKGMLFRPIYFYIAIIIIIVQCIYKNLIFFLYGIHII